MAEVNKISSFKSFSEIKAQENEIKLREENNLKKQETLVKIEEILDEMGLTSLSEIDEDSQQTFISKLLGREMNEGNTFVYAAAKAKAEGKTEFEFEGKTYKVTIKDTGVKEGNAFGDAVTKAKEAGEKEFEFDGKTYKVEESEVSEGVHGMATKLLQSLVDGETSKVEGVKMSKELAQHYIDWIRTSPYGKKNGNLPLNMLIDASFNWGIERGTDANLKSELKDLKGSIKESFLVTEGTRGQFGKIDKKGNITAVYTHYDSYPENVLPIIKKSYKNVNAVDAVIAKGDNSGLEVDFDKINFYGKNAAPYTGKVDKIKNFIKLSQDDGGAEYIYLFDERNSKWYMVDIYGGAELVPAFESVVNEAAVKQFDADFNDMVKNIKSGYGWIDPEFVEDTWENSSNSIDFGLVKAEIYKRLIAANLLAYPNPDDEEKKGVPVRKLQELGIKESVEINENSSEVEKYLANIASDYQFDKTSNDYTGFLNVEPNEQGKAAIEFINNVNKYKSLMKKFGLSLSPGYNGDEAVFVKESVVTEGKEMYKISINTQVEDSKIGNKFYNVKKGEKVELVDDDGDVATVKLKSGEIVNIESKYIIESVEVNEAEIKSDDEFKEYAMTVLKKAFGTDFDEAKGEEVANGILKKCDGDYGACVGMLTSSLGESVNQES